MRKRSTFVAVGAVLAAAALAGCGSDPDPDYSAICVDENSHVRVDEDACDDHHHGFVWLYYPYHLGAPAVGSRVDVSKGRQIHCRACNPHADPENSWRCPNCYAIPITACNSWRTLLRWTSHLADKSWIGATNWFDLIGAVARGDGDAPFITRAAYEAGVSS